MNGLVLPMQWGSPLEFQHLSTSFSELKKNKKHSKSSFVFLTYTGVYIYSCKCSILFLWKIVLCAGLLNSLPLVISLFLLFSVPKKKMPKTNLLSYVNNITGNGSHPKYCWMCISSIKELMCPCWKHRRCSQWTRLPNYVVLFPTLKDPF